MKTNSDNTFESMIFYNSFYETIKTFGRTNRLVMYDAIMEYAFNGIERELSVPQRRAFIGIKAQIDANKKKYKQRIAQGEHGIKGKQYGKYGGRPRKNSQNSDNFVMTLEDQNALDDELI